MTYRVQSRIRSPYRITLTEYALGVLALVTPLARRTDTLATAGTSRLTHTYTPIYTTYARL